jgi:hypothetical protein
MISLVWIEWKRGNIYFEMTVNSAGEKEKKSTKWQTITHDTVGCIYLVVQL